MSPTTEAGRPGTSRPARTTWRRRLAVGSLAVAGLVVTVLMVGRVGEAPGVFVGKVEVVVHPPRTTSIANPLATQNYNAVRFAGLITEVATNGEDVPRVTSQDLTLADQGMRQATLISLVNLGGQWANDFSRPFIRIEAVDVSAPAVLARLREGVTRVTAAMQGLQDRADVRRAERATTETVPAAPQVVYEGTHRSRAMVATLLVGLVITVLTCRTATRTFAAADLRRLRPAAEIDPPSTHAPALHEHAGFGPDYRIDSHDD